MGWATPRDREVDDLARSLSQIEAELRGDLDSLLVYRLAAILTRGSPLRWISSAPARHTARLGFADGLSVIAHSTANSGVLRLLVPLHRGVSILVDRVERTLDGVQITLCWAPDRRVQLLVTGFDQED